jgi:phosphopantothenoylcysteine decarboxylase/phosphopantothenate--cysteine ligase
VTGSIAAYKAAVVARLLVKEGADVHAVLTVAAREFVGPATFAGITGNPVTTSMWGPGAVGESHIEIAGKSDLILIAPATADVLARLATGRADDALTAIALCASCPILVAPAMHPSMWAHPATQRNVTTLDGDARLSRIGPEAGEVASGDEGVGRMSDPEQIAGEVLRRLAAGDLSGRRIVVTAGPTHEDIDPVRFVANRSSGKMGYALAASAAMRGAQVTLVSGPVQLPTPRGVHRVNVRSAIAMRGAVWQALGPDLSHADALVMAAAVGDYRPAETHSSKLKRSTQAMSLELTPNPDILAEVGHARRGSQPLLIGFALETDSDERVIAYARQKLADKRVDLVVANHAGDALERDDNRAALVTATHAEPLVKLSKVTLAERILDWTAACFREGS